MTAVAFDAPSNGHHASSPTNTLTIAHTCTGTNLGLAVFVSVGRTSISAVGLTMTITYNAVSMTEIRSGTATGTVLVPVGSNLSGACLFYLLNPAAGANNIVVSISSNVDHIVLAAESVTGTNAVQNGTSLNGPSQANSPTLAVTSAAGNLAVGGASHGDTISGATGTTTARATENFANTTSGSNGIIGDSPGAATSNINFTSAVSDQWVALGFDFVAVTDTTPALQSPIRSALRLR